MLHVYTRTFVPPETPTPETPPPMPITQDRMLALLSEGLTLDRLHRSMITALRQTLQGAKSDTTEPPLSVPLLCDLLTFQLDSFREVPWRSHIREELHFARESRRNVKQKEKMTLRRMTARGAFGPPASSVSPATPPASTPDYLLEERALAAQFDREEAASAFTEASEIVSSEE